MIQVLSSWLKSPVSSRCMDAHGLEGLSGPRATRQLQRLAKEHGPALAAQVLAEMRASALLANIFHFGAIIGACGSSGDRFNRYLLYTESLIVFFRYLRAASWPKDEDEYLGPCLGFKALLVAPFLLMTPDRSFTLAATLAKMKEARELMAHDGVGGIYRP